MNYVDPLPVLSKPAIEADGSVSNLQIQVDLLLFAPHEVRLKIKPNALVSRNSQRWGRFSNGQAPSRLWGRGVIMQPKAPGDRLSVVNARVTQ